MSGKFYPYSDALPDAEAQRAADDQRLREQITYLLRQSPFYRRKLREAGFELENAIAGLGALPDLPLTTKDELRAAQAASPPFGDYLAAERAKIARVFSTSGTTGVPSYIPLTEKDAADWVTIGSRSYSRCGLAGASLVTTFNAGPFVAGMALESIRNIGGMHIPVGTGNTHRLVTALRLLEPEALLCTYSYAIHIAEWAREHDYDVRASNISTVVVAGEPGGGEPEMRRTLEEMWNCKVYEAMGIGDIAASLWAECPMQSGMHFSGAGYVLPELIDPENGKPVPMNDGAEGELVYTHLTREAAPLLRFRSGDQVRVWSSPCDCGRDSLRVRCVGRIDDMLIVRGVNVFPTAVRDVVNRFQPRVNGVIAIRPAKTGVRQEPPLRVVVELADGTAPSAELASEIGAEIRSALIFTADVRLVPARTLPRSEYKSKLVDFSEIRQA